MAADGPPRRWGQALASGGWIALTWLLALERLYVYRVGIGLGPRSGLTATALRDAAVTMLTAGALLAAGPLGLWLIGRRRRGWLILAMVLFGLAVVLAVRDWMASLDAPAFTGG